MSAKSCQTYLTFDGNCRKAFEFYRTVFGGEFHVLSTFADAPFDMKTPAAERDRIMHVSLGIGSSVLMGSDSGPGAPPLSTGNNFSLSVETESAEESDSLLAHLAEGGTVTMPMRRQFWGAYFGMCTDRFGINWMVVCETVR